VLRELTTRLSALRSRLAPDHVHVHFNGPAAWLELLSRTSATRPTLTVHTPTCELRLPVALRRRILSSAGWIAAVSQPHREDIAHFAPEIAGRLTTLLYGVPIPPAPAQKPHGDSRVPRPFRFAGIGRLVESKGFQIALDAFARVLQFAPDSSRLVIAGDGPELANLQARAKDLGEAARHITFSGWIPPDQVHDWMQESDALIVPSTWQEPFGLVAVQAALAARPVIASRVGGLAGIVQHGHTGWLVPHSDSAALADRMLDCISSPETARTLGVHARPHAIERYSIERCRADYERLYNSATPDPKPTQTHAIPVLV
jgi:glycogen(starch) synthase